MLFPLPRRPVKWKVEKSRPGVGFVFPSLNIRHPRPDPVTARSVTARAVLVVYNNCGGPRLGSYIQSVGDTIYGDVPPEELLQFHYRVLNYREAPSMRQLCEAGLSADYVYRESKRALDGLADRDTRILAGIDVDVPIQVPDGFDESKATATSRAGVRDATKEALRAGVHGIVISRKYSEMKLENLSGAGDAVRG